MKTIHFESYLLGIKPLLNLSPVPTHTDQNPNDSVKSHWHGLLCKTTYLSQTFWLFFKTLNYTSWINNVCIFYDSINVIVMQNSQAFLPGTVETTVDRESGVERMRERGRGRERCVCVVVHLCKTTWVRCRRLPLMPRVLWAEHCWTYDNRETTCVPSPAFSHGNAIVSAPVT